MRHAHRKRSGGGTQTEAGQMEAVFLRFDSYDFESDPRFQDGLKVLQKSDSSREQELKLFFYNRFVEPIDRASYKQWSSASRHATPMDFRDPGRPSGSDTRTNQTSAETEVKQLSFAEVMKLIQEGKEVPGAMTLDVKPSNQSPTPSEMERIRKPWEISSSE